MYCIASVLVTVFQCTPIEKSFNNSLEGRCINNGQFWYANAGFSIATDVLIYLIPMPLICKLQIPWVQRIAIMMVFAMGGFVIVTSCLRLTTINIIAHTTDLTFQISSTMWTVIEPNVAIICACLPMIRPLIAKAFPKLKFHSKKGSENRWTDPTSHSGSNAARGSQANDRGEWLELEAGKPDEFRMASATQVGTMSSEVTIAGI